MKTGQVDLLLVWFEFKLPFMGGGGNTSLDMLTAT